MTRNTLLQSGETAVPVQLIRMREGNVNHASALAMRTAGQDFVGAA